MYSTQFNAIDIISISNAIFDIVQENETNIKTYLGSGNLYFPITFTITNINGAKKINNVEIGSLVSYERLIERAYAEINQIEININNNKYKNAEPFLIETKKWYDA